MLAEFFTIEGISIVVKYLCGVAGIFNPILSHSAFILVDQWIGSGVLSQVVELSSGKGWVERAPWAVCFFYKLPGSVVLTYLLMSKQDTNMNVVISSFYLIRYFVSVS